MSKVTAEYNLQNTNPAIANEWHPVKNGALTPREVTPGSNITVWWLCKHGHEWLAKINTRKQGSGCPYCDGKKVDVRRSLLYVNPILSQEWHLVKNKQLRSDNIMPSSGKKVWWLCKEGHEWYASPNHRSRGRGCPYCARQKVTLETSLLKENPALAKEWHLINNERLTPRDVFAGTGKKVWWICKRGHEWKATINSRNQGRGCPFCHSQSSLLELQLFTELKSLFKKIEHRKKIFGLEIDIFINNINFGIEVDGAFWHKEKFAFDKNKREILKKNNIELIRLREKGLRRTSVNDISFTENYDLYKLVIKILKVLLKRKDLNYKEENKIKAYLKKGVLNTEKEFIKILEKLPAPLQEDSLSAKNNFLTREWNYVKNENLTPQDVTHNSHKKVWWKCKKGHEWVARIADRNRGSGCPYCCGQKVCLATLYPKLAKEWYSVRNGDLTPKDVTSGTRKKVWWLCKYGHEWITAISDRRNGCGCPYCSGKKTNRDNCLETLNKKLAKEWHPSNNPGLSAKNVTCYSHKKVWWLCSGGHAFQATVANRSNGRGCPYCSGRKKL